MKRTALIAGITLAALSALPANAQLGLGGGGGRWQSRRMALGRR